MKFNIKMKNKIKIHKIIIIILIKKMLIRFQKRKFFKIINIKKNTAKIVITI